MTGHRAFTFIELLVVVAIISVLAGAAIPMIGNSLDTWRAERYGNTIWMSLRDAKYKAIAENRPVVARFKIDANGEVRFFMNSSSDGGGSWNTIPGMHPMSLPESVEIASVGTKSGDESGYACIEFTPDGKVSYAETSTASDEECDGSDLGFPIIHVSARGVELKDKNKCRITTIYMDPFSPTPQPYLIPYGAYDDFSAKMGEDLC